MMKYTTAMAALSIGTAGFHVNRKLASSCFDIQTRCQAHWCVDPYWQSQCLMTCGKCGGDDSSTTTTITATITTTRTDEPSTTAPATVAQATVAPATTVAPDSASASCKDIQSGCQLNWCGNEYWRSQCLATCGACENDKPAVTPTPTPTIITTLAPDQIDTTTWPSPMTTTTSSTNNSAGIITEIISRDQFDHIFAERNTAQSCAKGVELLSYDNFVKAAEYYPAFGSEGSDEQRKQEVAAFLGQISQETTGWWSTQPKGTWGLCFVEEVGCENGCPQYSSPNAQYPPVEGQSYHGRGAIQISHNYNYGQLSEVLYGDKNVLLQNPGLLASDGVLAFRASLWFWMTAQNPKPSSHDVMIDVAEECPAKGRYNGFGMTTNIINGGLECTKPTPQKVENRVAYYTRYAEELGVTTGNHLYCDKMLNYNYGGC